MAKKRIKAGKPNSGIADDVSSESDKIIDAEQQIKTLIEKGGKKGFLTYEEVSEELPEEAVSPARLDSLLATLDEMGITLLDEADVEKQTEEGFEVSQGPVEAAAAADVRLKEDELLEKQLVSAEVTRRIDDPIRMYLTQMGQIPLLTRKREIALARKIEITRMAFRRRMLQCDYCARNILDILQQVQEGNLSFDRTIKISTAENLIKSVIKKRMIQNCETVNKLLKINQTLFKKSLQTQNANQLKSLIKRIHRNKRKIATLLEELSIRISRIIPMKNKLHGICRKMDQLERIITRGVNQNYTSEDIKAINQ